MARNVLRAIGARGLAVFALLLSAGLPSSAAALPLISEVVYDALGTDDGKSFVELYGTPGTDLAGLFVEGINGSGGSVTHSLALSGLIPADGFFVLADGLADGTTLVPDADLIGSFDFQNGPDSIVLRSGESVLDAVGYGVFAAGDVFAGEGSPAPGAPAGASVARILANVDTGDNAADFAVLATPTPGTGDLAPVPEPGTALLLGVGLVGLGASGRRPRLGA